MSKADDMIRWRDEGLALAIRIAEREEKEGGNVLQALRKELRFRRASGVNSNMTYKELEKASGTIKEFTIQTVLAMCMIVLWEQYGFGQKRLTRFMQEFLVHSLALAGGEIDWIDILDCLHAETGIELQMNDELKRLLREGVK